MSGFFANLGVLASQNLFSAYFLIYVATIFLGNISAFASFWLAFQGFLGAWSIPALLFTIVAADVSGDLLWYSLGRSLRDTRFGAWVKAHLPWHAEIEKRLQSNGRRWMFFSKFIYASAFPIVFSVGWTKIGFKKFFTTSLLAIVVWVPILTLLAYGLVSGLSPLRAITVFKEFERLFIVGLVLFFVADYLIARLIKRLLEEK